MQPQTYTETASADFALSPLQVWFKLQDHEAMGEWHPDIDSVRWVNDKYGLGAEYIDYFTTGDSMRLRTTEYVPFTRFVSTIVDEDLPFSGGWTFELEKIPAGTRLTITENSEIPGAFFRALYTVMKPDTSSVEKFLAYF
jgi:hypothetical protein